MWLQLAEHEDVPPQNDSFSRAISSNASSVSQSPTKLHHLPLSLYAAAVIIAILIASSGAISMPGRRLTRRTNILDFLRQFAASGNSSDRRQPTQQSECLILSPNLSKLMSRPAQRLRREPRKLRPNPEDERGINETGKGFRRQFLRFQASPKF